MKKLVIEIDSNKCIGCKQCVKACHMGVIEIQKGKAVVVGENQCDGLGRCLGKCPADAIKLIEKEIPEQLPLKCGCPGTMVQSFEEKVHKKTETNESSSQLRQWPVQLHLVPTTAPYLKNAHLLICADCVAFAYGEFQNDLLRQKRLVIACPKLDDTAPYLEKLTHMIKQNNLQSITVAYMEVPCCHALEKIVAQAVANSGCKLPLNRVEIAINGQKNKS